MRSLRQHHENSPGGVGRRGLVLPRLLRRPLRFLSRLDVLAPRHAGLKGAGALILTTVVVGLVMGGHVQSVIASVTSDFGLAVEEIKITGQRETSELDVLAALALGGNASLATFDIAAARDRVEALPWVKQARLSKRYPSGLVVEISEREAFALWRHGSRVSIIDAEGLVLGEYLEERFAALPLVVGDGASMRAGELVALLDSFPSLKPRVKAAVLVADRRWNLVLRNGVEVWLPEAGTDAALRKVAALDESARLLDRDIARIDLRLPDRVVVGLTPMGLASRKAQLDAKAGKKGNAA
ncbi:MAG: cell division protein FtsQ/DivIB [Bauldia sp.]